jgi:Sulfatase
MSTSPTVLTPARTGWSRFLVQIQKDARLWLALLLLYVLVRVTMLTVLRGHLASDTGLGTLLAGMWSGMRFDVQIATLLTLPSFLVTLCCLRWSWERGAETLRRWWAAIALVLTVIITGIDIGYVAEYGSQFDQFLLGIIFDDFGAIVITIWRTYPVVWALLGMIALNLGLVWLLLRWLRHPFIAVDPARTRPAVWACVLFGVVLTALLVTGSRGSLGRRPAQEMAAAISPDPFINTLTPTPIHALKIAFTRYRELQKGNGLRVFLPDGNLTKAGDLVLPGHAAGSDIDRWTERTAPGAAVRPKHVFLLVLESYDGWSFATPYRSLGLVDGVRDLGKNGVLLTSFVSASGGTILSLSALLTGLPDAGVQTAYQPSARAPFPTSPAPIFKQLGYRTRFFYSGYLSWQRLGDFCRAQGFEDVFGGGSIDGGKSGNEWGVDDEQLLNYVATHVPDDTPSFNVILSTSYHPPFDVDVYGKGFPLKHIPPDLAERYDGNVTMSMFGHHWFSDRVASRFIRAFEERTPGCLFALTGDHWSRRFLNGTPTWPEKSLMPLLLYGPQVLAKVPTPTRIAGGHLDIAPTLIDLCAPAGFAYHSLGENILAPTRGLGFSNTSVVGPDFIAEMGAQVHIHPLPDRAPPVNPPDPDYLRRLHQSWHALGWWRLMKGNQIEEKK